MTSLILFVLAAILIVAGLVLKFQVGVPLLIAGIVVLVLAVISLFKK